MFLVFLYVDGRLPKMDKKTSVIYSDLVKHVDNKNVKRAVFKGDEIAALTKEGEAIVARMPASSPNETIVRRLIDSGASVEFQGKASESFIAKALIACMPLIILSAGLFFFFRRSGRSPFGVKKNKARVLRPEDVKIRFKDVAGCDEAKDETIEIVDFLKHPKKYLDIGGKIPKGVLMSGPPGTGKTLLARAIAGEAGVPFFTISGSDFVEMFVGVGASRVRDLFAEARSQAPAIIFIDEIDAVGRSRNSGSNSGNDEREQTLNQLLVEMDGFEGTEGIIVIAATNRPDILDAALRRPGRFDRELNVSLPDYHGRKQILSVHLEKIPRNADVDPDPIARGTPGFSGAQLANLVNEAALVAARLNKKSIDMADLEKAKDKVMMGAERKNMLMSDKEKLNTAWHEAGHAIVGLLMPEHDPVYKVTIIPRGRALGVTMFLPEKDRFSYSKQHVLSQICSLYGGRIAEEMLNGKMGITTGAANDIERATELARNMVTQWGFSENLGPILFERHQSDYLGNSTYEASGSQATGAAIDKEIKTILDFCYKKAEGILRNNADKLKMMAEELIRVETIGEETIQKIMATGSTSKSKRVDEVSVPLLEAESAE
jgi:cell division protease FtsH